jgi:MerR family transcriptional regulator, copper efflux regulator
LAQDAAMIETAIPISEVARQFGVRASALRYYEEIGLLKPAMRRSGRRYYDVAELKRLALIQLLQDTGRLSLEQIADILASQSGTKSSRKILRDRIAILDDQIRTAEAAKGYLEYMLSCPRENPFDGCPVLAKELNRRLKRSDSAQGDRAF